MSDYDVVVRPVVVETPRLVLRQWEARDTERYVELLALPEVTRFMLPMPKARIEALSERFLEEWRSRGFGPFAATERGTGIWIGQIGLMHLAEWPGPDKVEVGYELHPRVWGQGLAVEGASASLDFGFCAVGLRRVISTTNPLNLPSRRVMEKLGLCYRGIQPYHGHHTVWYSIDHDEWEARRRAAAGR